MQVLNKCKINGNLYMIRVVLIGLFVISSCTHPRSRREFNNEVTNSRNRDRNNLEQIQNKDLDIPVNAGSISLNKLYNNLKKSVFLVYTTDGEKKFQGSGFFISSNGLAISNYHVFEGTTKGEETIETTDGKKFKILNVIEKSKEDDYIIFKVNIGNYKIKNPISIVKNPVQIGDDVIAIGNPRGLESTLSKGIISGFKENKRVIQTSAEITYGSSGGPLLNMNGEVVGITTAGLGEANLNFAININNLKLYRFL